MDQYELVRAAIWELQAFDEKHWRYIGSADCEAEADFLAMKHSMIFHERTRARRAK